MEITQKQLMEIIGLAMVLAANMTANRKGRAETNAAALMANLFSLGMSMDEAEKLMSDASDFGLEHA
jgi:hypothetical protein